MTEVALTPEGRPLGHSAEPSERKTGLGDPVARPHMQLVEDDWVELLAA
jgi:hypothetical protein